VGESLEHDASAHSPTVTKPGRAAILASGLGLCHRGKWPLRSVTFSVDTSAGAVGIAGAHGSGKTALFALLGGFAPPARGELWVLGKDMRTYRGRDTIRRRVGLIPPPGRPLGFTVLELVTHAAWLLGLPVSHRRASVAGALQRLQLANWVSASINAAPDDVALRAWLAACTVHEPDLILVDGLLDGIAEDDALAMAGCLRSLAVSTALLVAGRDAARLARCCARVFTLTDGIADGG